MMFLCSTLSQCLMFLYDILFDNNPMRKKYLKVNDNNGFLTTTFNERNDISHATSSKEQKALKG